jgi:hypothetical protein
LFAVFILFTYPGAKRTFDVAVETAGGIRENYQRSKTLANIAELQAKSGDFDDAKRTAKSIRDR